MLGQHTHAAQVQLTFAGQAAAPALGHAGDGFSCGIELAAQGVFDAAVNNPLGLDALATAKGAALHQQALVSRLAQPCIEPQAGNAAADDADVGVEGCAHGLPLNV